MSLTFGSLFSKNDLMNHASEDGGLVTYGGMSAH